MPFVAINTIKGALQIGATLASSAKSIQAIKSGSTNVGGSGAPDSGGGGGQSAPAFNVVGNSDASRLGQTINERRPIRAFVVGNDVTTQQEMDRNTRRTATIG